MITFFALVTVTFFVLVVADFAQSVANTHSFA